MDILLTHGYTLHQDEHERRIMKPYPPLGILYLSSYLKSKGFTVGVYDSTFGSLDQFTDLLHRDRLSVVGIYTNMMTKFNVLRMIDLCKAVGATVILGGPEPPYYAAEYLNYGADVIVIGEGELTLEELLPHLARHGTRQLDAIRGIAYRRDDGETVKTDPRPQIANLSANPFPDREAIDIPHYMQVWQTHHGRSSVSIINARGCPYGCRWCSHSVYGNTHRRWTPQHAADEALWIKERYHPDQLWYADDVFAINHRWLYEYAAALKERGVHLPFECTSRADRLNEDIVRLLAEMGCTRVWNGSESGSQRVIDAMDRRVDVIDVQAKTHLLKRYGIETGMFIMLGYEGETVDDIAATVDHLKRANPDIVLTTVAYPIRGTAYYQQVEDRIRTDKPWAQRSDRDLTVEGRYSKRFYRFATRWMVNEVALHKAGTDGGVPLKRRLKLYANARLGRWGMRLTQHQRETSGQPLTADAV